MYPSHIIEVLSGEDGDRQRRREEAWRAWHRQPDALPLPDEEIDQRRRLRVPALVRRLRLAAILGRVPVLRRRETLDGP